MQEYVDICDYAVGLSRMIDGKVLPSERKRCIGTVSVYCYIKHSCQPLEIRSLELFHFVISPPPPHHLATPRLPPMLMIIKFDGILPLAQHKLSL